MARRGARLGRRTFLGASAAAAGASVACRATRSSWRFFTDDEARTLGALCDLIVPPDRDPGAAWAGSVRYIDRQLVGRFREFQDAYRRGLAAAGADFAALPANRQLEVAQRLEKDEKVFFDQLIAHTLQGYYGTPRHGGNRDYCSWRMLGVPVSPLRGRELPGGAA